MSRAVRFGLGGAVIAVALLLALLAAPDDRPVSRDPHSGRLAKAELDRVLRAVDTATTSIPRAELEARGRELFNSSAVAKLGESCGGCHTLGGTNADVGTIVHPVPGTPNDFAGPRDAPSLYGLKDTAPHGWVGQHPSIQAFVANAVTFHFEPANDAPENIAAIAAYLETIEAPRSANDRGRLSAAARRGEELFVGKGGCIGCHGGPDFTDNAFHVLGVPKVSNGDTDCGVKNPSCPAGDPLTGAFNTPTLRGVAKTGPYFHNGRFQTLRQVVEFYNAQSTIAPLALTNAEIDDLVEYLKSL